MESIGVQKRGRVNPLRKDEPLDDLVNHAQAGSLLITRGHKGKHVTVELTA